MAKNPDAQHGLDLRRVTEGEIQKFFIRHIIAQGGYAVSYYNGGIAQPLGRVPSRNGVFYCRYRTKTADRPDGTPDIVGAWRGRPFWIEVKKPGKKAEPEQILEQQKWKDQGFHVATCSSFTELLAFLISIHPVE